MGGCQSYPTDDNSSKPTPEFADVATVKLKNNNLQTEPSLELKPYLQQSYVCERIADMDIDALTSLPLGMDRREWLASNAIAFFQHINLFSSAMSEFCTTSTCPTARGPGDKVYHWKDEQGRRVKCSAPLYIDYAMSYIQELLADEDVFPTRAGLDFPTGFLLLVQKVFLLLYHALAHLYWAHFREVLLLNMHAHLNTLFIHFITFSQKFCLLEPEVTAPLQDLVAALSDYHNT